MMAKADATHVVVIERAHADTIKMVVNAGKDLGVKVMGISRGGGYGGFRAPIGGLWL